MLKYTDFFELTNCGKDRLVAALFLTYGFDAELFEHHILPNILGVIGNPNENELQFRYQVAYKLKEVPVMVVSDAQQYHGGRTFLYDQVVVAARTFHPKCYMLLFQDYLRVIIGSCNLTKSGLCYNAETVWHIDIKAYSESSLVEMMNKILNWIVNDSGIENNDAINEIMKFLASIKPIYAFPKMITTLDDESVFTQLFQEIDLLKEECTKISILSPFYENDRDKVLDGSLVISFCKEFKKRFPKAQIKIYFPGLKVSEKNSFQITAPVNIFSELCKEYNDILLNVIEKDWMLEDETLVPRNLHAKIIMAEFKSGNKLILSGSINFTNRAMWSKIDSLRNIEIGILEYGKINFSFPKSQKVLVNQLIYQERESPEDNIVYFVESAIYNGKDLIIKLITEKIVLPCRIFYNDALLAELNKIKEIVTITNFTLKRSQDLKIDCGTYIFYVPIQVTCKDTIVTEDLKLNVELGMKDIIDYLAGKYRSMSELERVINQKKPQPELNDRMNIYFRYNLQRYYKAMASLKQGLELPYYSERAFKSYLFEPIGLVKLLDMILADYKEKKSNNEETFLFIVEIWNITSNLNYEEDRLESNYKDEQLKMAMFEPINILKSIYKTSKQQVKSQYALLLNTYRLKV